MQLRPTRFAVLLAGFVASYGANAQETVALADSGLGVATSDVGAALAVSADAAATTNIGRISVEKAPKARVAAA